MTAAEAAQDLGVDTTSEVDYAVRRLAHVTCRICQPDGMPPPVEALCGAQILGVPAVPPYDECPSPACTYAGLEAHLMLLHSGGDS